MVGVIRKRDILAHPLVTIRCFGWRVPELDPDLEGACRALRRVYPARADS